MFTERDVHSLYKYLSQERKVFVRNLKHERFEWKVGTLRDCGYLNNEETQDLITRHNEKLARIRGYVQGEPITSLDELMAQDIVFMFGEPRNSGFIKSQQVWTIYNQLNKKQLFKIKKLEENEND